MTYSNNSTRRDIRVAFDAEAVSQLVCSPVAWMA